MVFQISTTWTANRTFFLAAESNGMEVDGFDLACILFAWDAQTVYGTRCETTHYLGYPGIELTATEALRFFAEERFVNQTVNIQWNEDITFMRSTAKFLRIAMMEQSLVPDYDEWKAGKQKWKLNTDSKRRLGEITKEVSPSAIQSVAPFGGMSFVHEWLNQVVSEAHEGVIREDSEVAASLESTLSVYPRLTALPAHQFDNEADWLAAVGFEQGDVPFVVCLELQEPFTEQDDDLGEWNESIDTDDGAWQHQDQWALRVLLRDKRDPTNVYRLPEPVRLPDVSPVPRWASSVQSVGFPREWMTYFDEVPRAVRIWQVLCPWLVEDGAEGDLPKTDFDPRIVPLRTTFDGNGAFRFLTEVAPVLVDAGYPVFAPSWWEEIRKKRARVKAQVSAPSSAQKTLFGLQQIVSFDWRVAVGDLDIREAEFETLVASKQRLLKVQGRWIEIRPEFVEQFRQATKSYRRKQGPTITDVLNLMFLGDQGETGHGAAGSRTLTPLDGESVDASTGMSIDVELDPFMQSVFQALQHVAEMPLLETPVGFQGVLRPYQRVGFSWLVFLSTYGFGACLADDMGLGKTVQYTAYLLQSRRASVKTPALLVCPTSVLGNWQKELSRFAPDLKVHLHYGANRKRGTAFTETVSASNVDIVLTSYSLCHLDVETLTQVTWDSICLDEAQNIKNPHTKQAIAIRQLPARHRIAMTGTPVENRLSELWSIFEFINPGYLGSLRTFQERFQRPIERGADETSDVRDVRVTQLKRLIGPFLLRRHKQDPAVELDLPEKMETKVFVPLTQEQAALYESVVQDMMDKLDTVDAMERRGLILASLTKLKQVCNHPALFIKEGQERTIQGRSAKVDRLLEMVGELRSEGDSCLIFTQFVEAGRLLQEALATELEESALFLHGGLSKNTRDEMVSEFQNGHGSRILILSLRAGGVGLNLTAANHVFHYDRWWNPAVENQATDRAYRIGQHRHVQVHKFVTLGTLEERIDEMIEQKSAMSEQIVGTGEQWITELSTGELRELFQLRRDWGVDE